MLPTLQTQLSRIRRILLINITITNKNSRNRTSPTKRKLNKNKKELGLIIRMICKTVNQIKKPKINQRHIKRDNKNLKMNKIWHRTPLLKIRAQIYLGNIKRLLILNSKMQHQIRRSRLISRISRKGSLENMEEVNLVRTKSEWI